MPPGFASFPSFEGERVLVHCRDINFEPQVGDGIEGIVNRRAKDNKLQAYKVFSYYYYSFLQPSFSIRYDGRAFLNRRGEQSGETGRAAGRGLDPQVAPRHRVSFAWHRIIFYCVARYHQLLEKRSWQSSPRSLSPTGFPLQPYPCSNLAGALRKGAMGDRRRRGVSLRARPSDRFPSLRKIHEGLRDHETRLTDALARSEASLRSERLYSSRVNKGCIGGMEVSHPSPS